MRPENFPYGYASYDDCYFDCVDIREWEEGTGFVNDSNEELGGPTCFTPVEQVPDYLADAPFEQDGSLERGVSTLVPE